MGIRPAVDPVTDDDVVALTPVLRRTAVAVGADGEDVDDVVQEALSRVLINRVRIDRSAAPAYAIVTVRNLVGGMERARERDRRHLPRLLDPPTGPPADEHVVLASEHAAMASALASLPVGQRDLLVQHHVDGVPLAALADEHDTTPRALAVRAARARARLRVLHILQQRRIETLPTRACLPVLIALSAGDTQRQRALGAGGHLLQCRPCAEVAPIVLRRDRRLVGLLPWAGLAGLAAVLRRFLRHPGGQAATATTVAAATVAAVLAAHSGPAPKQHVPLPAPRVAASDVSTEPPIVSVDGHGVGRAALGRLGRSAGERFAARGVRVAAVPADEAFEVRVGAHQRLWVQLVGSGESRAAVRTGDRVWLHGRVVANTPAFLRRLHREHAPATAQIRRAGVHAEVPYGGLRLGRHHG